MKECQKVEMNMVNDQYGLDNYNDNYDDDEFEND